MKMNHAVFDAWSLLAQLKLASSKSPERVQQHAQYDVALKDVFEYMDELLTLIAVTQAVAANNSADFAVLLVQCATHKSKIETVMNTSREEKKAVMKFDAGSE